MAGMDKSIEELLLAKDKRRELRLNRLERGCVTLSFNLNIPGLPKSNDHFHAFFTTCLQELKDYLLSHRIVIDRKTIHCETDAAGDFFLAEIIDSDYTAIQIKKCCESFETNHPVGRLLDVDVVDEKGEPVSSGKAKTCFFCNAAPAIYCMRKQAHDYAAMRMKVELEISKYQESKKKSRVCKQLAILATQSLLHEVALAPKPGLVDRFDEGSHSDMDFSTFLNSTAALSVSFRKIADFAYTFSGEDLKEALPKLRLLGLEMEADMFAETHGVNTHKGAIFLLGFSIFVSAYLLARDAFSNEAFVSAIQKMNGDLVARELGKKLYLGEETHGEVCFRKFGKKGQGIRGEIQAGMPCVFQKALPVLHQHFDSEEILNDKLLNKGLTHALLAIISQNDDSNILYRKGEEVLEELKNKAIACMDKYGELVFDAEYASLIEFCRDKKISPGGSADLLAVSYFMYSVNRQLAWNNE
ncbi:holo-ACP synthase/triphosphoribosyl-dephospho-CoA synthase [Ancylomarina subtilis]|uniref:Holo-ACP synthase/triphosphoribosyl-dephospho-CoA synthase n=2 Tax=Ancylomarina subtilis TaxID=1639035 RepID=A0A4Q7VJW9_9BACT|nr:holo-ACP synthase/triphosphoribosyl-dephospho-CoA synthase [Ancylomarina subtilis]